jgi:uncharacterized membrane protein YfbV (UPF0208 family)
MPKHWDGFPCFGKDKGLSKRRESTQTAIFRHFSRLARLLLGLGTAPLSAPIFRRKKMIDMSRLGQTLMATIGALVLTATAVGAAVGPARAIETAPISLVAAPVSGQAQA